MSENRKVKSALLSVYHKEGLEDLAKLLHEAGVILYSTGGTEVFLTGLGIPVISVENVTGFPEILGGRVKTLHPKVFGGILSRRDWVEDQNDMAGHHIPEIDLIVVDLYPFENTVASGASFEEIIEKIDIGGISLIRAAAKNFEYTTVISSRNQYQKVAEWLRHQNMSLTETQRKELAIAGFFRSAAYDREIFTWLGQDSFRWFAAGSDQGHPLRYGENPHQQASFFGDLEGLFEILQGKELSYNNLADIDAAISLNEEFENPCVVIIKHTNSCGVAVRENLNLAWDDALAGDPVSAFGGVIAVNRPIDKATAQKINELFFEVLVAPDFDPEALTILSSKRNRILIKQKGKVEKTIQYKTVLNGLLFQMTDAVKEQKEDVKVVTARAPEESEMQDLLFALRIVKHAKSNTIVLAKNGMLLGLGCGMTSRIDALQHAIRKAHEMGHDLNGAVMASDAFFPFPDCVEMADKAGIKAVVHPGGSVRDADSIDYCNRQNMAMVTTGIRHFKH